MPATPRAKDDEKEDEKKKNDIEVLFPPGTVETWDLPREVPLPTRTRSPKRTIVERPDDF